MMTAVSDALILLLVYTLAALYTAAAYSWLGAGNRWGHDALTPTERVGVSVVLGVLALAIANNFLSALIGSAATAWVVVAVPLARILFVAARRQWPPLLAPLRPIVGSTLAAAAITLVFLLAVAGRLFFSVELSGSGLLYADLPWHIGRVAEQAFQSAPGFWPPSPLAFPSPLPFVSYAGDSLAAATFRYLPTPIHMFSYSQVLFAWAAVLWTGSVLIASPRTSGAFLFLTTALLAMPVLIWGIGLVDDILFVFFHANPNSLIAWPVGLALAMHLGRSFRRGALPSLLLLIAIPPASLFFKANQAYVFGFLEAVGFAMWIASGRHRDAIRGMIVGAAAWVAAILLCLAMGSWPIAAGVHPSLLNFNYYASVAFPDQQTVPQLVTHLSWCVLVVAVVAAIAEGSRARRNVLIPLMVLVASLAYVAVGWWLVAPIGIAEGEPMHVNIEVMLWLSTAIVAGALCAIPRERSALNAGSLCAATALAVYMVWTINMPPPPRVPPLDAPAIEGRIRDALRSTIPDGHCFAYRRRYVIDVRSDDDADVVMAATGCPVINGRRWRGYLGDNRPAVLRTQTAIAVKAGQPFRVVVIGDFMPKTQY